MRAPANRALALAFALGAAACAPGPFEQDADRGPLLPRRTLLTSTGRERPRLSPDGRWLAFVASSAGTDNLWIAPTEDPAAARPVTTERSRDVRSFSWASTSQHLLYLKDTDGDEKAHLFVADLSGRARDLTPGTGFRVTIERLSMKLPTEVLVGINDRDPEHSDLHRIDVLTGKRTLVWQNAKYTKLYADDDLTARVGVYTNAQAGMSVETRSGGEGFRPAFDLPFEDTLTSQVLGVDPSGTTVYLASSRGRDTAALVEVDIATKAQRVVVADAEADVHELVRSPRDGRLQGAIATYDRRRWHVLAPELEHDLVRITEIVREGDIEVVSRTSDDNLWLVGSSRLGRPPTYWLYRRAGGAVVPLFSSKPDVDPAELPAKHPVVIRSRDGLDLVSYLSLPPSAEPRPARPLPMVLLVHGGPWARDQPSFDPWHALLASRGYAVLSVNFRGSIGFGKRLANAGNGEWGGKMQDDLLDATEWAIAHGIADRGRVAIMGTSYGGYAALAGLTFSPEAFACGVDNVGPSDLESVLGDVPAWWKGELEQDVKRIGDPRTPDGRASLRARSPARHADRIQRPLLVGQGANDPRVPRGPTDAMIEALTRRNAPVTYVVYPDEGHALSRAENRLSWAAVTEAFLAGCLGGRAEQLDLAKSSLTVPAGKHHVAPLAAALGARR